MMNKETATADTPVLVAPELIPIDYIQPSPANPRKSKEADIASLRESIRAQGLLHPIIVRKDPKDCEKFEIVMGERRWRACQGLWSTIPAVVRELSDEAAHEITVVENMQREDLLPMEEAAGIQTLLDSGKDIKEIADRLGKPVSWVARRSKLQNLSAKWRKALQKGEDGAETLSATHLEIIARFEQNIQDELFEELEYELRGLTIKELRENCGQFMLNMSAAPWPLDNPVLSNTYACAQCSKRSSQQPNLFDDIETKKGKKADHCLDHDCWTKKYKVFIEKKAAKLKEENPELVFVDQGGNMLGHEHELKKAAIDHWSITGAKKTDKGARQALIIDGSGAGTTVYVKSTHQDPDGEPASIRGTGGKKTMAEKKKGLEKRRTIRLDGLVLDELTKLFKDPHRLKAAITFEFMANLVTRFGAEELRKKIDDGGYCYRENNPFGKVKLEGKDPAALLQCVLPKIRDALLGDIRYQGPYHTNDPDRAKSLKCCEWFGFNDKELIAAVEKEIPVPKAWVEQEKKPVAKEQKAERKCRICGCTEDNCKQCIVKTGKPCTWIEKDLCSACALEKKSAKRKEGRGLAALIDKKKK
jgi:ParB/RepB/Spo0J family partition protein